MPPVPGAVPALLADLSAYLNSSVHAPLVQAALVHAQFESIHPFVDGNGRVGRALIHTVLSRRGLSPRAVLPVSLVLSTLRQRYVSGLMSFRFDGDPSDPSGSSALEQWLDVFMDAAIIAAGQATAIARQIKELQSEWASRVATHRLSVGLREIPRADSATARILKALTEVPTMTTATAKRLLNISFPPARAALEELAEAKVLRRKAVDRGSTAYVAREVLELITLAEGRLASTKFDTRAPLPNRPVPLLPSTAGRDEVNEISSSATKSRGGITPK